MLLPLVLLIINYCSSASVSALPPEDGDKKLRLSCHGRSAPDVGVGPGPAAFPLGRLVVLPSGQLSLVVRVDD